jgi:protein SCO1/2
VEAKASLGPEPVTAPLNGPRLRARAGLLVGGLAIVIAMAFVARAHHPRPPLALYGHVPSFRLLDQRGAPFSDTDMVGHVSVVDFVFTRCASSCPRLTARMAELQRRLERDGSGARLVSFSVDPDNDTPAVLSAYAAQWHADGARWSFLTGPVTDVKAAVVSGFKVAFEQERKPGAGNANDYDVTHGDWFVLVDGRGDLRGYYTTDDPKDVETLVRDLHRLESGG